MPSLQNLKEFFWWPPLWSHIFWHVPPSNRPAPPPPPKLRTEFPERSGKFKRFIVFKGCIISGTNVDLQKWRTKELKIWITMYIKLCSGENFLKSTFWSDSSYGYWNPLSSMSDPTEAISNLEPSKCSILKLTFQLILHCIWNMFTPWSCLLWVILLSRQFLIQNIMNYCFNSSRAKSMNTVQAYSYITY